MTFEANDVDDGDLLLAWWNEAFDDVTLPVGCGERVVLRRRC